MSGAEPEAPEPEGASEAFRRRQADAQFTVAGPAPEWALKWPGGPTAAPAPEPEPGEG